jgi:hypothetical protein
VKQGEKLGNTTRTGFAGPTSSAKLQGHTPADAKLSTMKYQIDYGDLTQFEKNVMKRLFPWYTFSRKNLPPLLEDLADEPGEAGRPCGPPDRPAGAGRVRPALRRRGGVGPDPRGARGAAAVHQQLRPAVRGRGGEDPGAVAQGDTRRVFQQLFGMAQPFVKLPAELATGTQMYSGRKLEDLQPYEFATLGGLLPETSPGRPARSSPTRRPAGSARRSTS